MRGCSGGFVRLWGCISQRWRADARRFPTNDAPSTKEDNILNERKSEMNGKSNGFTRPIREKIAARAHRIWEQEGLPPGREVEHWQQAERELAAANSRSQERGAPLRSAV
jgi:hypothetical protein